MPAEHQDRMPAGAATNAKPQADSRADTGADSGADTRADGRRRAAEAAAMARALQLAGLGTRGANPLVGAVILASDGSIIAEGHHRGAGTAHAETDALTVARAGGIPVAGATMVVTLEPCNHHGRTGPCSQAIIDAGISRLVFALRDPTAAAGGSLRMRRAGVEVVAGVLGGESLVLNHRWLAAQEAGRPFVSGHIGQTVDGFIAAADGTSRWITGPEARTDSHRLRNRADAILVGSGTVAADNPRLSARDAAGAVSGSQPLRVLMGKRPVPATAAIRGTDGKFLQLDTHSPAVVLDALGRRGIRHLLIEGGATVSSAFLAAGLMDELYIHLAPTLLGAGTPALGALGITTLAQAQQWAWDESGGGAAVRCGRDLRLHLQPDPRKTS